MNQLYVSTNADLANISKKSNKLKYSSIYIALRNLHFTDINPRDCGFQQCAPGHGEGLHTRQFYVFHYIDSGVGNFYKDGMKYTLHAGQCFLIRPGDMVEYYADKNNPWHYTWVGFNGNMAKQLDNLTESVFTVNGDVFEDIRNAIDYSNTRETYLIGCIAHLLSEILEKDDKIDVISMIKNYINSNYMFSPKITSIAYSLNMSRNHITKLFKERTGKTPQEYLLDRKMKVAKENLEAGMNVNETAQIVGYSDYATFSRAFKKYYGYSPSKEK